MKTLVILLVFLGSVSATEYAKGKIDMHGGKESSAYGSDYKSKSGFVKPAFNRSMLLDTNQSEMEPARSETQK
ncbi:MAG: hypothetical protein JXQ67_03650 [Campylobacterales bacterium]|nr:hypothetical protein [Campylobacterales bacterium]